MQPTVLPNVQHVSISFFLNLICINMWACKILEMANISMIVPSMNSSNQNAKQWQLNSKDKGNGAQLAIVRPKITSLSSKRIENTPNSRARRQIKHSRRGREGGDHQATPGSSIQELQDIYQPTPRERRPARQQRFSTRELQGVSRKVEEVLTR